MKKSRLLFFLWVVFFWGCNNTTTDDDIGTYDAILEVNIIDSGGSPANGAQIQVVSHISDCNSRQGEGISHGVKTTNSEGEIRMQLQKPVSENIKCITLNIRPAANSGLQDTSIAVTTNITLKPSSPFEKERLEVTY